MEVENMYETKETQNVFFTHNGLKVRLNHDFCTLNIKDEDILPWYISIESFDSMRGMLSIIVAILMMITHKDPIFSGMMIISIYFVGFIISQSYVYMVIFNMVYGLIYMLYSFLRRF
jgi:hypothetical protein